MTSLFRPPSRVWWLLPVLTLSVLLWCDARRAQRVLGISALGSAAPATDVTSPTGYASGMRYLIIPEHNAESYAWIEQTQRMLAKREWRVRQTETDNAPAGREVRRPSPYRWWLGLCAWADQAVSGRPSGQSVERAALFADPLLRILLGLGISLLIARHFGLLAAAVVSVGWAGLFPFSASFLPGQPDSFGLAQGLALASAILVLAGLRQRDTDAGGRASAHNDGSRKTRQSFALAGFIGGLGLWISVSTLVPVILGLGVGGLLASRFRRPQDPSEGEPEARPLPWLTWAATGAATAAPAYLLEYAPGHLLSWHLEVIHPLYALAWLGLGGLLSQAQSAADGLPLRRRILRVAGSCVLVAALPAAMVWRGTAGFLAPGALAGRVSNLAETLPAESLADWLARDGFGATTTLVGVPLLILAVGVWRAVRRSTPPDLRRQLIVAIVPTVVMLGIACLRLRSWATVDAMTLALVVAGFAEPRTGIAPGAKGPVLWSLFTAVCLAAGVFVLVPEPKQGPEETVTENDVEALIERDFAQWLGRRSGPSAPVVLASPGLTASLIHYGGVRGLTTPYWENQDGFQAALRIASATLPDEAQALAKRRALTHIVLASWSPGLEEIAQVGSNGSEHALVSQLHAWMPPRWLRPVAYTLPRIAGFENQSLVVFEAVDVQDNVTALARLAEYFAEMEQIPNALAVVGTLIHHFPTDLSALAARAQVAVARRDREEFQESVRLMMREDSLVQSPDLPWDRRVSVALVLAQAERLDEARRIAEACLAEATKEDLRSLSTASLFRLLALGNVLGLDFTDKRLTEDARSLLPIEMQQAL